jgi:hypothetical protein
VPKFWDGRAAERIAKIISGHQFLDGRKQSI